MILRRAWIQQVIIPWYVIVSYTAPKKALLALNGVCHSKLARTETGTHHTINKPRLGVPNSTLTLT